MIGGRRWTRTRGPCLQRTGVLSNRSLAYFGFQCFQHKLLFAQH